MDNTRKLKTDLDDVLLDNGITTIFVAGIATDYCVYFSAIDALTLGYDVKVIADASRGISEAGVKAAKDDMMKNGATIVPSSDVLTMTCPTRVDNTLSSSSGLAVTRSTVGLATTAASLLTSVVTLL